MSTTTTRPNTQPLPDEPAAREAEAARRRDIAERAVANARIEGQEVPADLLALWDRWIAGEIDLATVGEAVRAHHGLA